MTDLNRFKSAFLASMQGGTNQLGRNRNEQSHPVGQSRPEQKSVKTSRTACARLQVGVRTDERILSCRWAARQATTRNRTRWIKFVVRYVRSVQLELTGEAIGKHRTAGVDVLSQGRQLAAGTTQLRHKHSGHQQHARGLDPTTILHSRNAHYMRPFVDIVSGINRSANAALNRNNQLMLQPRCYGCALMQSTNNGARPSTKSPSSVIVAAPRQG